MRLPTIQLSIGPKLILCFMVVAVMFAVVGYLGTRTSSQMRQRFDLTTSVDDILVKSLARDVAVSDAINSSELEEFTPLQEEIKKLDQGVDTLVAHLLDHSEIKTISDLTAFIEIEAVLDDFEDQLLQLHEELLAQRLIFTDLYSTEKAQRYEVRTPIFKSNDPKLIEVVGQMQYFSKEALYQYRDQRHVGDWLESIVQVAEEVRSTPTELSSTTRQEILDQLTAYGQTAQDMGQIAIEEKQIRSEEVELIAALRSLNVELETVRNRIASDLNAGIVASTSSDRRILIGAIVAALFLAVGTGLFLSRSIAVPIRNLTRMAGQISRGNLDASIEKIKSNDEIGQLASSFNDMAGQLRTAYGGLEQRVKERTEELEGTKKELEEEIAERMRTEAELQTLAGNLEQSNRELQDFASVASHDLQEPLRKVRAFGDLLNSGYRDILVGRGQDYLQRMLNATERMQQLIDDLLTFSRVTSKTEKFVPVDLAVVAAGVMDDLQSIIEQRGAKVNVGKLPTIDADPTQMRQLLQNLISNALKFHRKDQSPLVNIRSEFLDGTEKGRNGSSAANPLVHLLVEDNGIGFDEKHRDRIFTLFQRLHGRGEFDGTGIGLAVCRRIAERHRGTITAESTLGRGSTFMVTLPLRQSKGDYSE